jgi:adenylate cyclase
MKEQLTSKLQRLIKLHLPESYVSGYLNDPTSLMARQNRQLVVMFTDIRSFTSLAEGMSPEDLAKDLNSYFEIMANIIYTRNGIIDKYIGDAILAYFGYPAYSEETALNSVLAAIEMIDATPKSASSLAAYHTAIGISLGPVSIGNVGHPERKLDFTIIGDTVNFASRLEGLTSSYKQELLIAESVYDKIKDVLSCRMVDSLPVRDGGASTKIFTTKKDLSQQEQIAWNRHNEGMDRFYAKDFKAALKCFQTVLGYHESDSLGKMMVERCQKSIPNE